MASTFITSSIVLAEALEIFRNSLRFGNAVHRDHDKEFKGVPKIGESFQIENPWRFEVQDGPNITLTDIVESSITMKITAHKTIPLVINMRDRTLHVDQFKKRFLEDSMVKLANQVDADLAGLYADVGQSVGTAGVTPTTYKTFGDAAAKLEWMGTPPGNRTTILDPNATFSMVDALKGLYSQTMVEQFVQEGKLTQLAGLGGLYSSQNIKHHNAGTQNGAYLTNGISQTGTNIAIDGGVGTMKAGDSLTIADVFSLNPVSYSSTGLLQEFVLTSDYAGGIGTMNIAPEIILTGPTRNVTVAASDNSPIDVRSSHKANLAFHRTAFSFATVPFELPDTASVKEQLSVDGITMTLTGGFDVTNYREIYRIDIIYGVKAIRPEWAVRILG